MLSLHARLLIAATLVLAAFLGLTGLALDRAFQQSVRMAVRERLLTQVYSLLAAAQVDASPNLALPKSLPEARFSMPGSGLYAEVRESDGDTVWRADSMLGIEIPFPEVEQRGVASYSEGVASDGTRVFSIAFAVDWEIALNESRRYTFYVAEARDAFDAQVAGFRRSLLGWLLGAAAVLLAVQGVILRWSLAPLREVAWEVNEIELGRRSELLGIYPRELSWLTENLNGLIRNSNRHLTRYRNALGDLAHSMKTPLAVMRTAIESDTPLAELRSTLKEQLERLDRTVDYQLQRAVASGRSVLATPIKVKDVASKLVNSFKKVYAERPKTFHIEIGEDVQFCGDEGDLMEILGNLIDNACKWSEKRVRIRGRVETLHESRPSSILLEVEDDGPGIPEDNRDAVLERGVRDDPGTIGHGIGLAVVRDLVVDVYGGTLSFDESSLGGALVRVRIEQVIGGRR